MNQHRFLFYILNLCELRNNRLEKRKEREKKCQKKGMLSWYWNDFNSRTGPFHLEPYIILYLSTWFRDGAKSLPETFIPFVNSNEIPVVVWHFIHVHMTKSLIKITECLFTCTITSSCSHVRYIHVSLRFHANTAVMFESMHVYYIVCCMRYFIGSWKEKGATKVKVVRFSKPLYQVE